MNIAYCQVLRVLKNLKGKRVDSCGTGKEIFREAGFKNHVSGHPYFCNRVSETLLFIESSSVLCYAGRQNTPSDFQPQLMKKYSDTGNSHLLSGFAFMVLVIAFAFGKHI